MAEKKNNVNSGTKLPNASSTLSAGPIPRGKGVGLKKDPLIYTVHELTQEGAFPIFIKELLMVLKNWKLQREVALDETGAVKDDREMYEKYPPIFEQGNLTDPAIEFEFTHEAAEYFSVKASEEVQAAIGLLNLRHRPGYRLPPGKNITLNVAIPRKFLPPNVPGFEFVSGNFWNDETVHDWTWDVLVTTATKPELHSIVVYDRSQ